MGTRVRVVGKLLLALGVLALAAALYVNRAPPPIAVADADAIATRMLRAYIRRANDIPFHYGRRRAVTYDDGREYIHAYTPCPDVGELRIFVANSGEATYSLEPDCEAVGGLAQRPRAV